jgi:hypothetical protein
MQQPLPLTAHAKRRVHARRIPLEALDAAIQWGRAYRSRGDQIYRLDRRSVQHAAAQGVDLRAYEGVTVVVTPDARARTAWRNRTPHRIWR